MKAIARHSSLPVAVKDLSEICVLSALDECVYERRQWTTLEHDDADGVCNSRLKYRYGFNQGPIPKQVKKRMRYDRQPST